MKHLKLLATASVLGVALAVGVASPAFAWHPKGQITKYVTNVTQGGAMQDANSWDSAVSAKPGDTLKYTIVVANIASAADNADNDMYYTKMVDTLPAGVQLVSGSTSADLGVLKPGQKAMSEITVKVTTSQDGAKLENKACFTGNSKVNDNAQSGCDVADVTVSVPPAPVCSLDHTLPANSSKCAVCEYNSQVLKDSPNCQAPVTPATPTTPAAPMTPAAPAAPAAAALPNTGAGSVIAIAAGIGIVGYAVNLLRLKRVAARQ